MPSGPSTTSSDSAADRYRLRQPLGRGGQGRTYVALDTRTGDEVAVKVIHLSSATGWKHFDLFERECQVLRSLDHPGIPRYLDTYAVEDEGKYCLVMTLVRGSSLRGVLERKETLAEAQLWNVLHQALTILEYLHDRRPPVIHRDLKPDNMIRRHDGTLALVDFGGVRVALRPEGGSTVVGTFGYMAPEQLHGEATAATDIFGLGATIAALATGTDADKLPRKGLKIDLGQIMPPSSLRDLLLRMLEPDPEQRLRTVDDVRRAAGGRRARARRPAPPATGPVAAPTPATTPRERDADADRPGFFLLRLFATMGYVGFVLVEAVFLPVLFFVISRLSDAKQRPKLKAREKKAKQALDSGREAMRKLMDGKRSRRRPRLPPHRPPPGPPPRPRGRRGRRG